MIILSHILIVLIVFSLYVQYSPTMGNIWLRTNSENEQVFCPMSLVELILSPLYRSYFWHYNLLPINFCMYLLVYLLVFYTVQYVKYINLMPIFHIECYL